MTLKTAKLLCNAIDCSFAKRDGEYRVNFLGATDATAYYTTDLYDAVDTAVEMHRQWGPTACRQWSASLDATRLHFATPRDLDIACGETPSVFYLTVGTRADNRNLVSLWDDPYSRESGKDTGDRLVDLQLTSAQRTQLFGN